MTPDTLNFMLLGFAVIFSVHALFIFSLWFRFRRLRREQAWLDENK